MEQDRRHLIVVGDRVLIAPEEGEERSRVGLYLPATAIDAQAVQAGTVVATGPGTPISAPTELGDEPWKIGTGEPRYLWTRLLEGTDACVAPVLDQMVA